MLATISCWIMLTSYAHAFGGGKPIPAPDDAPTDPNEPAYCNPAAFSPSHEIPILTQGIIRGHAFRLGKVVFVGLAVGNSPVDATETLAREFSVAGDKHGYCTWYFNKGNEEAENSFNWNYVSNPKDLRTDEAVTMYLDRLGPSIDSDENNMIACARELGYLAMGCTGQKHRGPTVFGMVLAYSGCSPHRANAIVNSIWGLNGVPSARREAIIRAAYERGRSNPDKSRELRELFSK